MEGPTGYWGQVTSTLDWCETNYEVSHYIAEYWNTLSNVFMILPPLLSCYKSWKEGAETRYMLCYMFLGFVGIGSWAFHMTLAYEMQLLDEIPMVWGTLMLIYALIALLHPEWEDSWAFKGTLGGYGVTVTALYLALKIPLIHQVAYGLLVALILYLDICVAKRVPCDVRLFYLASLLYYTGFLVWNIDNLCCESLQSLRQVIPRVFIPFTQLHALWHFLAGYGSYLHIFYCAQARALSQKRLLDWQWSGLTIQLVPSHKMKI